MADATSIRRLPGGVTAATDGGVLVVIAHPDDEVFVSGTICLCAEIGLPVDILSVTAGESGGAGAVEQVPGQGVADIRRAELAQSAAALGAGEPVFLGQADVADPAAAGPEAWNTTTIIGELTRLIRCRRPVVILTHGPLGGYGHAAHSLTYRCVAEAVAQSAFQGALFSFCARVRGAFFSWHFDQDSCVRIDARAFQARRVASLSCHRSQRDYFLQPYFPRTGRKRLSALFGYALAFTAAGRKRVPIATPERFFDRFPTEGLALQQTPADGRPHFFLECFADDHRVQIDR
ncbi:MAG: hypothetical protein E7812_13005 [Phenylobacterium sp.]|nr:MAG: hypothetical protein E7812_13005 [Phenylobacterium sp.]